MKVEIAFCSDALARRGYSADYTERTVRRALGRFGLACTVEAGGLTVHGRGEDDFADLWLGLMALLRSDWFPDCAAKCVWYDDDGTSEDVLAQAWKLKT